MQANKTPNTFPAMFTILEWTVVLFLLIPFRAEAQTVQQKQSANEANLVADYRSLLENHATPQQVLNARFMSYGIAPDSIKRPKDPWLGFDKVQHFTFSTLLVLSQQYILVNKLSASEKDALKFSVSSTAFIGLFKEIYDLKRSKSRYFSKRDLVADAAGILLAAGLIQLKSRP